MKYKKLTTKMLSLVLSVAMVFAMMPTIAFATGGDSDFGVSNVECHVKHDEDCGYTEAVEGADCSHKNDDGADSCANETVSDKTVTPDDADKFACTHEDDCGYTEAIEGADCKHTCEKCDVIEDDSTEAKLPAPLGECTCDVPCTRMLINADCIICTTEGTDLVNCKGESPVELAYVSMTVDEGTSQDITGETLKTALEAIPGGTNGKDIVIEIPSGVTFYGTPSPGRIYENLPNDLASLTLKGEGTFRSSSIANNDNLYLYMHGVPLTVEDITFVGGIFGGTVASAGTFKQWSAGDLASTSVTIRGKATVSGSISGGSVDTDVGTVNLNFEPTAKGSPTVAVSVQGGNALEGQQGNVSVDGEIGEANIAIAGGIFGTTTSGYIYGGGNKGCSVTETNITMTGGSVSYIFGGGNGGTVGDSNITIGGTPDSTATVRTNVFAGGMYATQTDTTNVTVNDYSLIRGGVYGGGFGALANVTAANVTINGGIIVQEVYGGGYLSGAGSNAVETANLVINGGTMQKVLGGGYNKGGVTKVTDATVTINGGDMSSIYAGGDTYFFGSNSSTTENSTIEINHCSGNLAIICGRGTSASAPCTNPKIAINKSVTITKALEIRYCALQSAKDVVITAEKPITLTSATLVGEENTVYDVRHKDGQVNGMADSRSETTWASGTQWVWKNDVNSESDPTTSLWRPLYTITFDTQGGSTTPEPIAVPFGLVYGDTYGTENSWNESDPRKSGYEFVKWTTDTAGVTDTITKLNYPKTATDHTLYAQWKYIGSSDGGSSSGGGGGKSSTITYPNTVNKLRNGTVSVSPASPFKGQRVTITPKPDEGYEVDQIIVKDANGKIIAVTEKDKNSYTFTQPAGKLTVEVTYKVVGTSGETDVTGGSSFTDVTANDWFYDAVKEATEKGWFSGTSETTFSPNLSTTRGMIATILHRVEGTPDAAAASFDDVAPDAYYAKGIAWAESVEVVKGYGNGNYGPDDNITREQLAAILYRYAHFKGYDINKNPGMDRLADGDSASENTQFKGYDLVKTADLDRLIDKEASSEYTYFKSADEIKTATLESFADGDSTSAYAKVAMEWAVGNGLISGRGNNTLAPTALATRAEVAAILLRFETLLSQQ